MSLPRNSRLLRSMGLAVCMVQTLAQNKSDARRSLSFGEITSCIPGKFGRIFEGTCRLQIQARKENQSMNQLEASSKEISAFRPRRWRRYIPLTRRLASEELYALNPKKPKFLIGLETKKLRSSQSSCVFRRSWIQILAHIPSILTEIFLFFPWSLQINSLLRQYHFLKAIPVRDRGCL
jgi:hypothetical protein